MVVFLGVVNGCFKYKFEEYVYIYFFWNNKEILILGDNVDILLDFKLCEIDLGN